MGTFREGFFLSQVQPLHKVEYTDKGDSKLDRRLTIEVGGANKSRQQLAGLENAYVADVIEVGYGAKVPLWMLY